jgi:hypothetical protein
MRYNAGMWDRHIVMGANYNGPWNTTGGMGCVIIQARQNAIIYKEYR